MASPQQILANRLNAQRSTGPRTFAGKAASSQNALKSGIDARTMVIRGESHHGLNALRDETYARWQPATPEERFLVDTLITNQWFRRRYIRVEAQLWEIQFLADSSQTEGNMFAKCAEQLSRLQRRLDGAERNYHRALKELQKIAASKPNHAPEVSLKEEVKPQSGPFLTSSLNMLPIRSQTIKERAFETLGLPLAA